MSRWVVSYIDNSRIVVTQGTLSLLAQSEAIIESISAAGGGGGKAAVYGAVSLNFINTDIASYIKDCSSPDGTLDTEKKLVNVQGDITLIALDKSSVSVIAGNVAGSGTASVGAAIAISYIGNGNLSSFDKYVENDEYTDEEASEADGISESDYDYDDPGFTETSKVRVYIDNSTVTSTEGAILLKAAAENDISNITAGTAAGGKAGVQGSVSVNYLYSNVWVQVLNGSTLTADGDIVLEVLSEGSSIRSLAGAVAGGGNAGAGIAIAVNHIANSYLASVEGSQVISDNGDIVLTAWNDCAIKTLSAAITGGGNLAVAGAVSANFIHNNVSAAVINSIAESNKTDATMVDDQYPGIRLTAKDSSSIESISGQVNASETVGIGAAAGYNTVGNTIKAYISDSSVVTSKTYITVKALSEAYIKTVVAGGGIGSVSINGSVAVNSIGSHVLAYIDSSQVISTKSIALLASDASEIGAISGPVGGAYYASVGASVAVNYLGTSENPHLVHAYIFNSKVVSQEGGITLYADSDAIVKSISAAGGAAVYVAVNGAISVNYVYTSIGTFIKDCNGVTNGVTAFGDIKLDAIDRTAISVIAGSISGAGLGGGGAAVAIVFIGNGVLEGGDPAGNNYKVNNPGQESDSEEFDYNKPTFSDDNKVMAFIDNSFVESEQGSVRITAKANSAIFNISAGAGVGGAAGLQGSVSVNYIYTGVTAYILNGTVEAGGDIVIQALTEKRTSIPKSALQVDSADGDVYGFDGGADDEGDADSLETQPNSPEKLTNIQSIAGAVAGGGGAGLGAAVAVNHVVNTYSAYVFNSTLKAGNDIIIEAHSLAGIETVSAAAAAGSGTFAAAGSVSLNFINNTILAYISSSEVTATDNIIIDAEDSSVIKSVSGQINFSGSAGLGAAAAYNEIANTIKAYVDMADATQSVLIAGEDILVRSQATATISSICASGSFGANFGGSATVVINMIDNTVSAYIADADVIAQGNLYILAQSLNETNSYGGSIGGGSVGIGAAVIVNIIENDTEAHIVGSSVKALGNGTALTIPFWDADGKKQSDQALNGLIIFAYNKEAITVYSGSAGVGQAGISGQVSTNIIKNATKAYIDSSTINRDGDKGKWVILRAIQDTGIQIYAGSLAAGLAAVGGAVDATYVTNNTSAYLKDSEVYAGNGVDVTAITGLRPLSGTDPAVIIAGESLSAMLSMAGAVSVVVTENINEAYVLNAKVYSLGSIKVLSSHNILMDIYGGTVAGSAYVGAGGTVVVSSFKNTSRAQIIGSDLNATGVIELIARSRDLISVKVGTAGVAGVGVAGAVSVILVETTTEASVIKDGARVSLLNQDSRFRPGGTYAPINGQAQTILVKADNKTEVNTLGGALGAGALGIGAAVDYTSIQNRTVAMIGSGSKVYAAGDINLEALSEKVVDSKVYSVGGGLFGVSGAVSIICVGSPISEDGAEEFNDDIKDQINNDMSPNSRLNYKDDSGNTKSRLPEYGIGAKVAQYISGVTGPNVNGFLDPDLNTENKITAAFVQNATMKENRAEIVAGGNVNIHALSKNDLSAQPNNAAAGAATAGGTVAYIFVAENNKAYLGDYGYLRANNTFIKAESFAKAKSHCESAAASVVGGVHAYIAYADIQPVTTAYIGSSADVIVTEKIQIDAEVTPEVAVKVQGINIAGGANVGISKAEAVEKPVVIAYIGDNAKIIAGPQPVSGNPNLTLISRGKLTGAPGLEFKSNTIILDGQFTFKRGVVMSGDPKLTFNKANSTITRDDDGSWLADGFEPDMNIEIIGTWLNDGTYKISAVSEKSLTLTAGSIRYDETTGSNSTKDFNGDFTLDDNEDGMLTLIRTDGDTGWTWAEVGLLPGDYLHLGSGEELQSYRITSINGHVLTLDVYTGEIDSVDFTQVSLERIARDLSVKATGDKAQDRVTYNGGSSGKSLEDVFNEGDYFAILIGDMEALGYNSGVYQILGFEDDGFTAILDTMGYVKNNGEESGAAVKEESSEITRKNGSWLEDGFVPGDVIYISGTQHNNGYFEIKEIINDGKTIVLYRGEELTYEKIEPGSTVSIISQGYDRIVRDTGSFEEDGFMAGQTITVDNSDKNNGIYRIKAISADGKALILEVQDVLKREISQNVLITITGDYNAGLSVHAKHLLPVLPNGSLGYTARADAEGISGSILASVNGIYATATVDIIVTSYIGNYADIYVLGDIEVNALNFSRQFAYTTAVNAGGLSISANKAKAASTSNTNAKIGNDVSIRGNDLRITAYGDEENYAQAVAGSGGVISGLAAQAETYFNGGGENHGTNTIVGRNSNINVGLFSLLAEHMLKFNSRVDTTNASIFGASGGLANNTVISDVQALIGEDVVLTAYNIQITAGNRAEKDWLESGLNNVNSGSGGIADFPASRSLTDISFNTEGIIGDGAHLTVIGDLLVPGSLTINTFNELLAKDKVKLAGGGAIAVASAQSIIKADTFEATVTIGEEAKLNSVGDINLSALALADIETKVDVSTWGAASAASGKALSRVKAVNTVTLNEDAYLYAEGAVSLMAGQNSDEQMNKLTAKARVDVDNNGVAPVHTNPSADGEIYLTNYINIKPGALIQSVSDTNLIAQKGPTIAEGKATGHDWIKSAYGAEIKGGTGKLDLISTIRVDGTIQVGLRSQQILIINEDGTINEQESSDGIPVTREKAILAEHILNEINHYKKLAAEYAGTEAGTAFANQAKFLEQELVRMGIDISRDKPLPIIWIDLIIVGDIKAEQSNINVLAEEGSLIGNGVLNASTQPALIKIINNSPHYLVLNSLHIPERDGGLLYYNYDAILGNDLNRTINSKNKAPEANFTISTSASAGSAPSRIHIENSWSGSNPPSIEVRGSIKNVGTQTNPGTVTIQGTGGISTYSSIEAGDLNINAGGSFMQSYTDSLLCVGGVPRAHWGDLAKWFQGSTFPYPYQGEQVWFWSINPYKNHQDWIDSQIEFTTVHTTRGYLSAGTSYYTTLLGGEGHDMFSVYSNLAELRMEGQDGNDKFVLRAFALADPDDPTQALMNVDAGGGDDYIEYNINAKVNINGGDGFDRVVAIGSEFDDVFIVTRDGITGAGLNIVIGGAEECFEAYGMEGNDTFYIQSTREGTITILVGGLGSDEFIVMGDVTKAIATSRAVTYIVPHDLDSIMGPLIIEGDNYEGGAQFTVFAGVGLPYEDSGVVEKEIVPVDESNTKDKMYVYNDGSTVGETGLLTENNLSGLGMCEGFIVNEGTAENPLWVTYFGGITYGNLEVIEILLSSGNDDFTVQDTAEGAITAVHGGGGNDTITIKVNSSPLVVYGDTSEDGNRYSKTVGDGPLASGNSFDNPGNDTIHAGASTYGVIIYGGAGDDIITGSQRANYLTGGAGNDTIYGEDGADIIFGDSGFNVDLIDWMIQVPTTEAVGADTIYGGEGNNIIFGDHGRIYQTDLPAGTLSIVPREILVIEGINVFNNGPDSGSDTIYGAAGSDIIIGGDGSDAIEAGEGANVVLGDFGQITFSNDEVTRLETTDPEFGGNDEITTGTGDDIIFGGAGSDTIYAGDGHDLVLGDSGWVAFADGSIEKVETIDVNYGGDDLIIGGPGDDILIGGSGSDIMDGNEGMDLIIGDNAALELSAAGAVPGSNITYTRFRVITGATIYDRDGNVQIGTVPQYYPGTAPVWAEFMITLNNEGNPGDDYLAGGAGNDIIFGQKGNDVIQGDGSIRGMLEGNPVFAVRNPDGILNLNPSFDADTDGDDYIEGGGGNDIIFGNLGQDDIIGGSSNLFGLNTPDLREDGSDFIFGGSGTDIDRNTVGNESAAGHARDADFILGDNGNIYRLVNSAGQYLTFNYDNYGTRETERIIPRVVTLLDYTPGGPDYNSSAAGNLGAEDEIHGEAGDDVIYGMTGDDILFGEGQDDDIIGGWGNDWISAGTGIDGVIGDDGWIYTNRIGTGEPLYGIKSSFDGKYSDSRLVNRPYERGQIYKTLLLDPVNELRRHDKHFDPLHADDIIYGGLGNDFLNGGAGDDAISGTEALPKYYSVPVPFMAGKSWPYVGGGFDVFHPFDPPKELEFILDYDESEIDGDDIIWGSFGDDWLVGAAGNDLLFGGSGNDVINAYDSPRRVISSSGKQTWDYYNDVAYGGDGSDYLIGNKGDCLVFNRLVNTTYLINDHASHLFNGRMLVHFFPGQGRTFILLPEETHYGDYFIWHSLSGGSIGSGGSGGGGGGGYIKPNDQEPQSQPLPVPGIEPEEPGGAVVELQFETIHQLLLRTTLWKLLLNGWKLPVSFVPEEISAWLWFGWMQL